MRRFVVGLLAVIGFITLLAIGGVVLLGSVVSGSHPTVSERTVLKLDWRQLPGEEGTGGGGLFGPRGATLADTVDALRRAAADKRVIGLVATLSGGGPGFASVQELREAIAFFRAAGKFTIVFTESFDQGAGGLRNWYLATAFEQVWLQPSGDFGVVGIAAQVPFLKGGLDKLGVRFEGGRRMEFKSAPSTFLETGFTPAHRENLQGLIDSLFKQVIDDVARDRNLQPAELRRLIDSAPLAPADALTAKVVDKVGYRDEVMAEVERRAGRKDALYDFEDYLGESSVSARRGDAIAVVSVEGAIVSGDEGSSLTGDRLAMANKLAKAIDEAAADSAIKAIVVRIDSPGGSYSASDTIRRAVERARQKNKPVVVSFGDVAASGGYFAALPADLIVAQRGSITGSIGVFGLKPVIGDLLDSLGIKLETLTAGANAAMSSPARGYTPQQQAAIDRQLDRIYADFTRKAGDARKLEGTRLDAAARGRVFTGADAKAAGLVDELGGLTLAIAFAKAKAGIDAARETHVRYFPAPKGKVEQLMEIATGRRAEIAARTEMQRITTEIGHRMGDLPLNWQADAMRLPPMPPLWD